MNEQKIQQLDKNYIGNLIADLRKREMVIEGILAAPVLDGTPWFLTLKLDGIAGVLLYGDLYLDQNQPTFRSPRAFKIEGQRPNDQLRTGFRSQRSFDLTGVQCMDKETAEQHMKDLAARAMTEGYTDRQFGIQHVTSWYQDQLAETRRLIDYLQVTQDALGKEQVL